MKTVVITGGTDGLRRGLARIPFGRGERVAVVGTAALAVVFVGGHPTTRYANDFAATVATSFAGDHDEAEAARIGRRRVTGNPVKTAVKEVLPFPDPGSPGHPVAVSGGPPSPWTPRRRPPPTREGSTTAPGRCLLDEVGQLPLR